MNYYIYISGGDGTHQMTRSYSSTGMHYKICIQAAVDSHSNELFQVYREGANTLVNTRTVSLRKCGFMFSNSILTLMSKKLSHWTDWAHLFRAKIQIDRDIHEHANAPNFSLPVASSLSLYIRLSTQLWRRFYGISVQEAVELHRNKQRYALYIWKGTGV
jgi:hypothetical protein